MPIQATFVFTDFEKELPGFIAMFAQGPANASLIAPGKGVSSDGIKRIMGEKSDIPPDEDPEENDGRQTGLENKPKEDMLQVSARVVVFFELNPGVRLTYDAIKNDVNPNREFQLRAALTQLISNNTLPGLVKLEPKLYLYTPQTNQ